MPGELIDTETLHALQVDAQDQYLRTELLPTAANLLIKVTLLQDTPTGALRSAIILGNRTGDLRVKIPVFARVFGDYRPVPETIFFGTVRPGDAAVRENRIEGLVASDVVSEVSMSPDVQPYVTLDWTEADGVRVLKTTLKAPDAAARLEGTVLIRIGKSESGNSVESISLPVIATIAGD